MERIPQTTLVLRSAGILVSLSLLLCFRRGADSNVQAQNIQSPTAAAQEASAIAGRLVRDYPDVLDSASRSAINAGMAEYGQAGNLIWHTNATRTALTSQGVQKNLEKADGLHQSSVLRITAGLRQIPGLVWLSEEEPV